MPKKINIPHVTGDVIITATASVKGSTIPEGVNGINYMTYGKGVNSTTGEIENKTGNWGTINAVSVEQGESYTISCDATWAWVFSYDENDNFVSVLTSGSNVNPQNYTFTTNTTKIRFGCYDPDRTLTYCNLSKTTISNYMIVKNISNCTFSNTASTVVKGASYSTTVLVNDGYTLNKITVLMSGSDITSSVVKLNTINIPSVTGDLTITVTTTAVSPTVPSTTISNMTYGKGINQTTGVITDNPECWATVDPITVVSGKTYQLDLDATWGWVFSFDDSDNFVSALSTGSNSNPQNITFTADTNHIRYGCYDPNKGLTYCNLTEKSSSGGNPGGGVNPPSPPTSGDLTGTYLFFGDSICYGGGTNGYGYPQAIKAKQPAMTSLNYGVSGTCIAKNTSYDVTYPSILSKIQNTSTYADYIVLEGGVNDSWGNRNPIGTFKGGTAPTDSAGMISYGNSLNEYQFADALEKCFIEIKLKWWGRKIFFVITHRINESYSNPYFDLAIQICNKWGVIVIDLRNSGCTSADTVDGTHPTRAAYDNYYAPNIINVLKANK